MKLLQFLQYAYLIFAALFLYDAVVNNKALSWFFAALALFMFFFRKKYRKKFEDRGKL